MNPLYFFQKTKQPDAGAQAYAFHTQNGWPLYPFYGNGRAVLGSWSMNSVQPGQVMSLQQVSTTGYGGLQFKPLNYPGLIKQPLSANG